MYQSQINKMYIKHEFLDRVYQGDILRDLNIISWDYVGGQCQIKTLKLPYAVVMTQDCDLDRDYKNHLEMKEMESKKQSSTEQDSLKNASKGKKSQDKTQDKYLPTILICPAYLAEALKAGTHLDEFGQKMQYWNSDMYKNIKSENNDRFHYLEANQRMQVPEIIIDFKHYYTVPRNVLYKVYDDEKYLASLNQLYRELLSQRFFNYFSRIGLPDLSKCEPDDS